MKKMHLSSLFEGKYDLEYATQRLDLAIAYSRTGIDIKTFLGAFNDMLYNIGTHIMQQKGDSKDHFDNFKSLLKAAALDAGLMMDVFIHQREKVIRHQQETLRELSTPVLQLRTGLLILPIIGMIDTLRARQITESLLQAIRAKRAKIVVMDITGVPAVDSKVANHLLQTFDAAKLMGAHIILTGLSADVAQALVALGIDLARMKTFGELQDGIEEAEYLLSNKYFNLSKSNQRRDPSVSSNT
jgi:rsbT co-antagonist protein RsbR